MTFAQFNDTFFVVESKFKQSNHTVGHELCSDGAAFKSRKFFLAKRNILFDLDNTYFITATLNLHRKYIVSTFLIHSYINLICLNLTKASHGGSQMILD